MFEAVPMLNKLRSAISAYKFTITSKQDPQLLELKNLVRTHNKAVRSMARRFNQYSSNQLLRVSLMARGPRRDKFGRRLHHNCDSNLQHKYANRFDVYIHYDSSGNDELREEIKTGLSSSQQRKIRKTNFEILKFKWDAEAQLERKGIYKSSITDDYGNPIYLNLEKYIAEKREMHPNMTEATFKRLFCKCQ